jgi:hypothetical protein
MDRKLPSYNPGSVRLFAILLFVTTVTSAQFVFIGPRDPDYCTRVEQIKPNLKVSGRVHLRGTIVDRAGAPLKGSQVVLRNYVSETVQLPFAIVKTNSIGEFDFQSVPKGDYRLLASPSRAFKQPDELSCGDDEQCFLKITLKVNNTDMPDSVCPIR